MGICGFGWSAQEFHLPLVRATGSIDLVAVYDPVAARRNLAAAAGASILATPEQMEESVRAARIDLVLIASPSAMHADHAGRAIRGGAHVIVEKPVAQSSAEWRHLSSLGRRHDRVLIPFHNRLFDDEHRRVIQTLATNRIGQLLAVESTVAKASPPIRRAATEFRPRWRLERRYGGGVLADWGPHKLEQLHDYVGAPVISRVTATSVGGIWSEDCDDFTDAYLEWGAVRVRLLLSYIDRSPRERLRITGTAGVLRVVGSDADGQVEIHTNDGIEHQPYENRPSDWQPLYDVAIDAALQGRRIEATRLWNRAGFVCETIDRIRDAAQRPIRIRKRVRMGITLSDVDDDEWDTFLLDSPGATIFHSTAWTARTRRRFLRIGARDARGLVAGIVLEDPASDGLRSLAPYSGPVVRLDALASCDDVLAALASDVASRLSGSMFIASPWAPPLRAFVCGDAFRARLLYSAVVDIDNLNTTIASFSSSLRGNIRAAERTLAVDAEATPTDLLELVTRTFRRQELPLWFDAVDAAACIAELIQRDRARVFIARDPAGIAVGGVAVAWDARRAYYLAGGYDAQHAQRGATSLALWHAMQFVRRTGTMTFDLEGSHIPAIERFFRQFGATWLPYYVVKQEGRP